MKTLLYYSLQDIRVMDYLKSKHGTKLINKDIIFNDTNYNISLLKYYSNIFVIIDNQFSIAINNHGVICNMSLDNGDTPWYTFLCSTKESYLNIKKYSDNQKFINIIKEIL